MVIRGTDGVQRRFTQSELDKRGIEIFKDGKLVRVSQLNPGDQLTATIVSSQPPTIVTETEVDAKMAQAKAAPAPAKAEPAPAKAEPAPAKAEPAPAKAEPAAPAAAPPAAAPPVVASTTPVTPSLPADEVGPAGGVAVVVAVARDNRHRDRCVSLHAQEEELTAPTAASNAE